MRLIQRLISTTVTSSVLLVLLLAGPLHYTVHHHDHYLAHDAQHAASCHGDLDHSPNDDAPDQHSSHACPICVLLSIGYIEPICVAPVGEHQPALTGVIWIESTNLPIADRQLPGAHAPPATAIS